MLRNWLSYVLLLAPVFTATSQATAYPAASCSTSDVQTAINKTVAGDTVTVPAGTCAWTSLTISGIQLIGAGKSTSGTVITGGTVTMTKHATQITRLSGFRFTGSDVHASVGGSPSSRAYVIDNNYLYSGGSGNIVTLTVNGGVLHHNDFYMDPSSAGGPDVFSIQTGEDWSQATTFGNTDTQGPMGGERNIYFEDNTFTNILETSPDGDQGTRLVIRHNQYTDSSIVFHSGGPINDSSTDGTRQFEIYNNTFSRVTCNDNMNKWIWVRGGSGVIANNAMDNVNTSCFGGKNQIRLGVGCNGGSYPEEHQIGQTTAPSTQDPPTQPMLIFGNTGAATSDPNFIAVNSNDTGGGTFQCSSPSTYVQSGRDYMTSNTWSWTPFTYPHPLTQDSPTAPAAPTNLQVVVD